MYTAAILYAVMAKISCITGRTTNVDASIIRTVCRLGFGNEAMVKFLLLNIGALLQEIITGAFPGNRSKEAFPLLPAAGDTDASPV